MIEHTGIYLKKKKKKKKKNSAEYARIVNGSDAVHSINSLRSY